jgi:hypothetical protein
MKAVVLYCDRCAGEGKGEVRASLVVWIRTSLGGRTVRLDACADHFAMIVGQASPNGAAAPDVNAERVWRGGPQKTRKAYDALALLAAKRTRFSTEEAMEHLGKDAKQSRLTAALRMLVEEGTLERHMAGIYQRPGYTMPEPASVELAATAALKLVRASPGMRAAVVAALAGVESIKQWRATLDYLRAHKLVRTKGEKSAMRMYAR